MRIYDIIAKKRDGKVLTKEEIEYFIKGYVSGDIPDYQVSALLMAIYLRGMTDQETSILTDCMVNSGDKVDLSSIPGIKVDKHSTGGVGDKTTFVILPIVAACGVPVAKMSGRGLGYTGGTIDKMESIPGIKTSINHEEFLEIVRRVGASVIGQSGNMVPADKKLYALRDVTATIESIPLIASSIMSKKIAAGADCILLDVKFGSGAFMKSVESAIDLSKAMVAIGENMGRKTIAMITDMNRPIGFAIGNSLEIIEVCDTLRGKGPSDLSEICINLSANMLYLAGKGSMERCTAMALEALKSGKAFIKLKEIIAAQGGDTSVLDDTDKFEKAKVTHQVLSDRDGYIYSINTERCGIASVILGAGRENKRSKIDFGAGIIMNCRIGNYIAKGDCIATLFSSSLQKCFESEKILRDAITIKQNIPNEQPLILARITKDGIEKFL